MSTPTHTVPHIRTYAEDLEHAREIRAASGVKPTATPPKIAPPPAPVKTDVADTPHEITAPSTKPQPPAPPKPTSATESQKSIIEDDAAHPNEVIKEITKNEQGEIRDKSYEAKIITDGKRHKVTLKEIFDDIVGIFRPKKKEQSHEEPRKTKVTAATTGNATVSDYSDTISHLKNKQTSAPPPEKTTPPTDTQKPATTSWEDEPVPETSNKNSGGIVFVEQKKPVPTVSVPSTPRVEAEEMKSKSTENTTVATVVPPPSAAKKSEPEEPELVTPPKPITQNPTPRNITPKTDTTTDLPYTLIPRKILPIIPPELQTEYDSESVSESPSQSTRATIQKAPQATNETSPSQKSSGRKILFVGLALGVVLMLSSLAFAGYYFWSQSNTLPTSQAEGQFRGSVTVSVVPTVLTKERVMGQITAAKVADATVTEINLLSTFGGEPMSGSVIADALGFTLPAPTKANLDIITVGFYRNNPWLLMRVRDSQAVRGGMLQWEVAMPQNLQPLFTTTTSRGNQSLFRDDVVDNIDVRLLRGTGNQEEIVYGFVDFNVILITTDTVSFLNLKDNYQR